VSSLLPSFLPVSSPSLLYSLQPHDRLYSFLILSFLSLRLCPLRSFICRCIQYVARTRCLVCLADRVGEFEGTSEPTSCVHCPLPSCCHAAHRVHVARMFSRYVSNGRKNPVGNIVETCFQRNTNRHHLFYALVRVYEKIA
jgi:hypothetical protein